MKGIDLQKHAHMAKLLRGEGIPVDTTVLEFISRLQVVIDEKGKKITTEEVENIRKQLEIELAQLDAAQKQQ